MIGLHVRIPLVLFVAATVAAVKLKDKFIPVCTSFWGHIHHALEVRNI